MTFFFLNWTDDSPLNLKYILDLILKDEFLSYDLNDFRQTVFSVFSKIILIVECGRGPQI